jgi:hypothetical protein
VDAGPSTRTGFYHPRDNCRWTMASGRWTWYVQTKWTSGRYFLPLDVRFDNPIHTCLDNDIKKVKQIHPHTSEPEVIHHVTKYNFLASLQGIPRWHKAQLQDLLAMVEKCGMPHLFLTLTVDEISSLRWEDVTDIETIAKKLENSFTWKDCPMECKPHSPIHLTLTCNSYHL